MAGFVLGFFPPVHVEHWAPPLQPGTPYPHDWSQLPADHRAGRPLHQQHSGAEQRQGVCSLPGFDALLPGPVPGVSKLGPGFLLLFSVHTAAAFITEP